MQGFSGRIGRTIDARRNRTGNANRKLHKLTKLTKLNCPRSCSHRKELLAQLGLRARKYSSCDTFSSWHASSFRKARIKIIICVKSIRAAINRCLNNASPTALSIHTIGLTENSLQGKILHSQVRSPATFPFGSEQSRRTSVPQRCEFHIA